MVWIQELKERLLIPRRMVLLYGTIYFVAGLIMNSIGKLAHIAEFGHWWQVFTCYVLYLVPMSLLVRNKSLWDQYLFGLWALALLELVGYSLGTSIAHPGNILDQILGERNFTLAMTVFFATYIPGGNLLVAFAQRVVFGEEEEAEALEMTARSA